MMQPVQSTRERLLVTAMELMANRGYHAVGVQEICTHAGVNKGSFYHFFPSKLTLLLAVLEAHGRQVQAMWDDVLRGDGPPLDRLRRLFDVTGEAFRAHQALNGRLTGCPVGNLAQELSHQDEHIRQKVQETFQGWAQTLQHVLDEAVQSGALPDLDTGATAQALVAYFEGVVLLAKTQNDPDVVTRLAPAALRLIHGAAERSSHRPTT